MILIKPRVMQGCRDWWDRNVGPTLLLKQQVDEAITAGQPVVWWLPDGRLLTEQPRFFPSLSQKDAIDREIYDHGWSRKGTQWKRHPRYENSITPESIEAYFAMPQRAIILEYGDQE
jgi:hypothetical protein